MSCPDVSDDDIEAVVAKVACLTRTLDAITENGYCLVLKNLTCFLQRELFAGDYCLYYATEIHFCHIS